MRIFQVIKAATNSSVPGNQTWYRNLYEPLIDMGCEVFLFPANDGWEAMYRKDKQLKAKFSQRLIDTFIKEHEKAPFDVFFSYIMDGIVEPAIM
ncbi:MAG: hypothetical protein KKH94_08665, partial [Candidatus Omnitrophica bacterium]|nr:hypothetical protein [Candidatus Omnitrophota bacterium]